jgi:hypothetical protein
VAELADAKKESAHDWLNNHSCQERIRHKGQEFVSSAVKRLTMLAGIWFVQLARVRNEESFIDRRLRNILEGNANTADTIAV